MHLPKTFSLPLHDSPSLRCVECYEPAHNLFVISSDWVFIHVSWLTLALCSGESLNKTWIFFLACTLYMQKLLWEGWAQFIPFTDFRKATVPLGEQYLSEYKAAKLSQKRQLLNIQGKNRRRREEMVMAQLYHFPHIQQRCFSLWVHWGENSE